MIFKKEKLAVKSGMIRAECENASDEALFAVFSASLDENCMKELTKRYAGVALSLARMYLHDEYWAEDAVQEAFLKIVRKRSAYDASRSFATWFFAIVRNTCLDFCRSASRHRRLLDRHGIAQAVSGKPDYSQKLESQNMLNALSKVDRIILILKIYHGLNFAEIAESVGSTEGAVKKRSQRALKRLRALNACDAEALAC